MDWRYYVTPAFIARTIDGTVEIRRLDTDQWEDKSFNQDIFHLIEQDGYSVSETEALTVHEKYKTLLNH
ncbi:MULTISPECIES: hypothetical protein [unclassified Neochlamydia]|uniref:hypothetical protein n=1 Tax=unclassified Neochlamydia TaxID=2643326 RepID=UPI001407298D|nr:MULTISPECIES: hypothetical protein [unclassified Neochlamydia]MBS4169807.1 Uncharacterized protein [Neochlamydia sp. AcF95]NGY95517.1 hypothetical protein [Neochlamydia sp. AcF84]